MKTQINNLINGSDNTVRNLNAEKYAKNPKRSHKAEFQRWRAELEAKHGMMIYDRLSDVIDTNDDLTVGDMVLFTNDYGVTFGPHEILGFCKPDSFLCPNRYPKDKDCGIVFLDSDAYWFPDRLNQLTLVSRRQLDAARIGHIAWNMGDRRPLARKYYKKTK